MHQKAGTNTVEGTGATLTRSEMLTVEGGQAPGVSVNGNNEAVLLYVFPLLAIFHMLIDGFDGQRRRRWQGKQREKPRRRITPTSG